MVFQMAGLGKITSSEIEREIRRRGIYIEELRYPEPVIPSVVVIPVVIPEREPWLKREPWLPIYPSLTEPELDDLYKPPYTEELLLPYPSLTPVIIPEAAKPASRVGLVLIIVVLGLAALTNNKKGSNAAKWRQTMARSRAM